MKMKNNRINELYKSTYNSAAADAMNSGDSDLAMDFLNHSNRMGIEDEPSGFDHEDKPTNYMFFSNIDQIIRQLSMLSQLEPEILDQILQDGHDWADDHMTVAKENIDQVFNFIINRIQSGGAMGAIIVGENRASSFSEFTEINEKKKKKGMWENIHAKRKRGERPAKPGDEDYPSKEAWEENTKRK